MNRKERRARESVSRRQGNKNMNAPTNGAATGLQLNFSAVPHSSGGAIVLTVTIGPCSFSVAIPVGAIEPLKELMDRARKEMPLVVVPGGILPPKETASS